MASTNESSDGPAPIPVTVISGFLGVGKTTLLKYIFENSTIKIACVVHDLSDFNIEPKHVRNSDKCKPKVTTRAALPDMVELQDAYGCRPATDELFPAFAELMHMSDTKGVQYERLIWENSGVADPPNIRDLFNDAVAMEHPVTKRIYLDAMLTVVDASTFIHDFASKLPMAMRPDLGGENTSSRPVVDILVDQVECSDIVILNKADTLDSPKLESHKPVIASFNPLAHIVTTSFGKIPLELLNKSGVMAKMNIDSEHRAAIKAAKADAKHLDHDCAHPPDPKEKSVITQFIYLRRKPFHPLRLRQTVSRWLPDMAQGGEQPGDEANPIKRVLRSKGFCWLANNHRTALYWSHAGQHFELREEGDWWVTIPPDQLPRDPRQKKLIYEDFDSVGTGGDRRQEIVFIGSGMDEEEITKQMDAALLTEEEMEQYHQRWSDQPDP